MNKLYFGAKGGLVFQVYNKKPWDGAIEFEVTDVELWAFWLIEAHLQIEALQNSEQPMLPLIQYDGPYWSVDAENLRPLFNKLIAYAIPSAHVLLQNLEERIVQ